MPATPGYASRRSGSSGWGAPRFPPLLRPRLQDQVLENLISQALLTQRTQSLGYRVSHDALRDAVHNEPAFQVGGQYSPEAAKAALAQAGISLQTYEDDLRTSVERVQLEGGIRTSEFFTGPELARLTELEDQEREVRYLLLPLERFKSSAGTDDAAVNAYYKAHQGAVHVDGVGAPAVRGAAPGDPRRATGGE